MIKPTVGRVVWYYPPGKSETTGDQPHAATVAHVWDDRMVNLGILDSNGEHYSQTSVPLIQEGDEPPMGGRYCAWMPYQKGQAAKYEALEKQKAAS